MNSAAHFSFDDDEHRHAVEQADSRRQTGAGVPLDRLLAAHGQVAQHHFGAALAQAALDVDRLFVGRQEAALGRILRHVLGNAVMDLAHVDGDAVLGQVAPDSDGIVGEREAGVLQRPADLARIDIERAGDLDIARLVAGEVVVHQADGIALRPGRGMLIELNALEERGCAVAHSDDRYSNLRHIPLLNSPPRFPHIAQMLLRRVHLGRPREDKWN